MDGGVVKASRRDKVVGHCLGIIAVETALDWEGASV